MQTSFTERVENLVAPYLRHGVYEFEAHTAPEARRQIAAIRLLQKQLRLVRKDIAIAETEIRLPFATRKSRVGAGWGTVFNRLLVGRRRAGKINMIERDRLRRKQYNALSPYEDLKAVVDQHLVALDRVKLDIDSRLLTVI